MPNYLVCASATAEWMPVNACFDKCCSRCGSRVMIAPSGQRLLLRKKRVEIVCVSCVRRVSSEFADGDKVVIKRPPGSRNEIASAVPNLWRKRN